MWTVLRVSCSMRVLALARPCMQETLLAKICSVYGKINLYVVALIGLLQKQLYSTQWVKRRTRRKLRSSPRRRRGYVN